MNAVSDRTAIFFFQAEDGIRDYKVTGVQTCALPIFRAKLHEEAVVNKPDTAVGISKTWWNYIWVNEPALEKNKWMQFRSVGQIAETEGKRVIDAFLDLVVEEKLETRFLQAENNIDDEALSKILTHPNALIGLGDGG